MKYTFQLIVTLKRYMLLKLKLMFCNAFWVVELFKTLIKYLNAFYKKVLSRLQMKESIKKKFGVKPHRLDPGLTIEYSALLSSNWRKKELNKVERKFSSWWLLTALWSSSFKGKYVLLTLFTNPRSTLVSVSVSECYWVLSRVSVSMVLSGHL